MKNIAVNVRIRYRVVKMDNSQFDVLDTYVGSVIGAYTKYGEAKTFADDMNEAYFDEIKWAIHETVLLPTMQLELRLQSGSYSNSTLLSHQAD